MKKSEKQRRAEFLTKQVTMVLTEIDSGGHCDNLTQECVYCKAAVEQALKAAFRFARESMARADAERNPLA